MMIYSGFSHLVLWLLCLIPLLQKDAVIIVAAQPCTSSVECSAGQYCSRPSGSLETACTDCNAPANGGGCVAEWAIGGITECLSICNDHVECSVHSDCGTDGEWCGQNLRCYDCNDGACWTMARLEGKSSLSPQEFPTVPIDLSCPEQCCDWGMSKGMEQDPLAVGPCDSSRTINAYWVNGTKPDITISELKQEGKKCDVTKHSFVSGYPQAVSIVRCDYRFPDPTCLELRTVGVTSTDGTIEEFVNDDVYPHDFLVSTGINLESCGIKSLIAGLGLMIFIIIVCAIVIVLCCLVGCLCWACSCCC